LRIGVKWRYVGPVATLTHSAWCERSSSLPILVSFLPLQILERLVWPHVKTLLMEHIQVAKSQWAEGKSRSSSDGSSPVPVVILEAAVLLDAEWDDMLDGVWVITAPREVALKRLMETRGLSEEESNKRIDAQQSRRGIGNLEDEIQKKTVSHVINNSGSEEELTKALRAGLLDPKSWK
jgi:dephospho-CoA kinase